VSVFETPDARPAEEFVLGPSAADWAWLGMELRVDPVTFEIIRHKLEAINEEQGIALKDVSVSPIVTAASDFNNALYTADGRIASMGPQVVFHSGAMPVVLRHVREAFPDDEILDGDMFIVNDPYFGAVHHPDVSLVAPIFHDGKLVAWSGVAAHQVDMGGMTVGSISVRAREKQQEGLMMPPMKLIERGKLRRDLWNMVLNMTRQPQMVGLDLKGFIASNVVARDRLIDVIRRYGHDTVVLVMEELIRYSERRLRERLLRLPDAELRSRGFLDHDGIENRVYRTDVRLIKSGDVLRYDLSASAAQAPTYINCTEGALVGAIFGGMAPFLGAGIPWNHGLLNAIEVVAPKGLIVNAQRPAATGAATIGQGWTVMSVTAHVTSKLLALSDELRQHSAAVTHGTFAAMFTGDRNQHGEPYTTQLIDAQIGGGGASAVADGIDQSGSMPAPRPHIANVESNEIHGPMLFLYRAFFPDTGGDGATRGGRAAGTAWTPHGVERLRNTLTSHGVDVPVSAGQFGGMPGACNRAMVIRGSRVRELYATGGLPLELDSILEPIALERLGGQVEILEAKADEFPLVTGDVLQYTWQGGGGYGDPLERAVDLVERDLATGMISVDRARGAYGVVSGDAEATAALRADLRARRLAEAEPPLRDADTRVVGSPVAHYGPQLVVGADDEGELTLQCRCGYVLCGAQENWKERVAWRTLEGDALPTGVMVHSELELVQYLCPACGCGHGVETKERGEPPLQDLLLISLPPAAGDDADAHAR
jgi:N-methylhydantoinase B